MVLGLTLSGVQARIIPFCCQAHAVAALLSGSMKHSHLLTPEWLENKHKERRGQDLSICFMVKRLRGPFLIAWDTGGH